jgi:hypothetical protein
VTLAGGDNIHAARDPRFGVVMYERGGSEVTLHTNKGSYSVEGIGAHADVGYDAKGLSYWIFASYNDNSSACGSDNGFERIDLVTKQKVCLAKMPWGTVAHISANHHGTAVFSWNVAGSSEGAIVRCAIDGSGCQNVVKYPASFPDSASTGGYWCTVRASEAPSGKFLAFDRCESGDATNVWIIGGP